MTNTHSSRRAFFLKGGAALGAGVAATTGVTSTQAQAAQPQQAAHTDREAILQLYMAFTQAMEHQHYSAAAGIFHTAASLELSGATATGKTAITALLAEQYPQQALTQLHTAYRPNALRQQDEVAISDARDEASAIHHVDVQISTPVQGNSTIAQMARLQGTLADQRWESGRLQVKYVKERGQWQVAALHYLAT